MSIARRITRIEHERGRPGETDGILFLADDRGDTTGALVLVSRTGAILALADFQARYPAGTCDTVIVGVDPHRI